MRGKISFLIGFLLLVKGVIFSATVELKNIISIEGYQSNPLLGYGIVVGLKGTGDSDNGSHSRQILAMIAKNFGFRVDPQRLKAKNSAVVLVTANLTPFSQAGSMLDVKVSSVYDAKSLEGGELIVTPLLGGDNEIYAIAHGKILVDKNSKGINGIIPQGARVEKNFSQKILNEEREVSLVVDENIGVSSVFKVVSEVEKNFKDYFVSFSGNTIKLKIPEGVNELEVLSKLFSLRVEINDEPSVIIDSLTGIVIAGGNVVISEAAISYKNMQVNIGTQTQPASFFSSRKEEKNIGYIKSSTTVSELVESLNQLGISGKDIAKIIELLYKNGNLKARLIIQ
ncbi:MAG: flagellar basal body P-ring protein FlgI [Brevinematia bacterium]